MTFGVMEGDHDSYSRCWRQCELADGSASARRSLDLPARVLAATITNTSWPYPVGAVDVTLVTRSRHFTSQRVRDRSICRRRPSHQRDRESEPLRRVEAELVDVGRPFIGVPRRAVIFVPDSKAPLIEPLASSIDVIDLPHQRTDLTRAVFGEPGAERSLAVYRRNEFDESIEVSGRENWYALDGMWSR
jgi:hypothetical protein